MARTFASVLSALVLVSGSRAQDPSEVMFFGVFHFANPGRDVVRVDQIDVTTADNQAYLEGLADRLCAFRPTVILLEFDPSRDAEVRAELDAYRSGEQALTTNEIQQIGFRVAQTCGVDAVRGFDENEVQWNGGALFEHLEQSEPEVFQSLMQEIGQIQEAEAEAHRTLSLRELLLRANDPELDRLNMDFYLMTNGVGAGSSFVGADATASWWHRNFRMYANVQQHATPGARVLVVAGQGHTAILKKLAEIDRRIVQRDVRTYL